MFLSHLPALMLLQTCGNARREWKTICPEGIPLSPFRHYPPGIHIELRPNPTYVTHAASRPREEARILQATRPLEKRIRSDLKRHLLVLGFRRGKDGSILVPSTSKDSIRALHRLQRVERLRENESFIKARAEDLLWAFASGREVCPESIRPQLQVVRPNTEESDLFRLATFLWSIPVSQGYGRRLRYLVWDKSNCKLIGLIALGDPSFNLAARDSLVGWSSADRQERLIHMMDAFILGAVPPYNSILGGKLVASLVRSRDVVANFRDHYRASVGLISQKSKHASLVAVTTSSALGRSSVYNRLALGGVRYFTSIGFTGGWGHFHIPRSLFEDMRKYLALRHHNYGRSYEFGDGPNWRLRTIRAALDLMGFDADLLRHGVTREVFFSHIADNALRVLRGEVRRPSYATLLSAREVSLLARQRWMVPRASRDSSFALWERDEILGRLDWRSSANGFAGNRIEA